MKDMSPMDLSVVIITLNEELQIEACLDSLPEGCEIIVIDSNSQDNTKVLAEKKGALVLQREFDNFATQKNFAIKQANRRWILSLDADEVLSPKLKTKIVSIVSNPPSGVSAFRITRNLIFMHKRLRFGKTKDRPVRLFLKGHGYFARAIHERVEVSGPVKHIPFQIEHDSYANLTDYFKRFNRYTSEIAKQHLLQEKPSPVLCFHVLRPWGDFIVRYFLRLGFLDGYPGYAYALFSGLYGFVKYSKLREIRNDFRRGKED